MSKRSHSACFTFSDQEMPVRFGKYHLLSRIASDPLGEEFLAAWGVDEGVDQLRVLRCIYPKIAAESQFVALFSEEARSLSRLSSANVARVMEVGILGGVPFVCREHVEGMTLERAIELAISRTFLWPWEIAAHVAAEILRGLDYVHRREDLHGRPMGKRHGDVRPCNILLSFGGEVKLTNFGSTLNFIVDEKTNAALDEVRGRFVPPEGIDETEPHVSADLWGAALTFLSMLGGGLPAKRTGEELRPWLPPAMSSRVEAMPPVVDAFLGRALNPDQSYRFETAEEMRNALLSIMGEHVEGHPPDDLAKWVTSLGDDDRKKETDIARRMLGKEAVMNLADSTEGTGALGPGAMLDGRYHLLRRIGEGGMGVVFEAEHMGLGRRVAVKVLHDAVVNDTNTVERFRREAQIIGRLGHPNIVGAHDFGVSPEGYHYLAMDYLVGHPLTKLIEDRSISARQIAKIVAEVCDGLQAAHEAGVIHRDLKPDNIFLTDSGARILDFGIAKSTGLDEESSALTRTGHICGTVDYIAPEQIRGLSQDPRSDLYAAGVIIYEALTGETPFHGRTVGETLHKVMNDKLVSPRKRSGDRTIPGDLESLCMKALSRRVDKRFSSASDMARALRTLLPPDEATVDLKTAGAPGERRSFLLLAPIAAVVILGIGVFGWFATRETKDVGTAQALKVSASATTVKKQAADPVLREEPATPDAGNLVQVIEETPNTVTSADPEKTQQSERDEAEARAEELVDRGERLLKRVDFEGAKKAFKEAVKQDSKNSDGWFGLAKVAFQKGNYQDAARNMNQAMRHGANRHKRNFLGKVYMASGEKEKAVKQWKLVLKTHPNDKTAKKQLEKLGEIQ